MPSVKPVAAALRALAVALLLAHAPRALCASRAEAPKAPLRILAVMTVDTMSHHLWMSPLTTELARRGHLVTSVDVAMPKDVPATMNVSVIETAFQSLLPDLVQRWINANLVEQLYLLNEFGARECGSDLRSPTMQRLLASDQQFDLILIDYMADCQLGVVHRFGYPGVVALSPFPGSTWIDDLMGNPPVVGVYPMTLQPYPQPMALWQRAATLGLYAYMRLLGHWSRPDHDRVLKEVFGPDAPSAAELRRSVHLALVNENPVLEVARPLPPNVIAVGGMHIRPANLSNIPPDIRAWLDAAEKGFVYVSFGSVVKGANIDPAKLSALVESFGALGAGVRVLWKMDDGVVDAASLPPNTRTASWMPQNDILGHPKLLLFVSHCGGLSTQESAYSGVPMLGVPFIVDQFLNLEKVVRLGIGRRMPFREITKERFLAEVQELLQNPTYRRAARRVAELLREEKESPLERAVWWAEYVGRHREAPHLRPAVLDVPWPQVLLLDVILLLAVAALVVVAVLFLAARTCLRLLGRLAGGRAPAPTAAPPAAGKADSNGRPKRD